MNFATLLIIAMIPVSSFAGEKMFCIKMDEGKSKIVTRACYLGHQLRLDTIENNNFEPVFIVDLQSDTSIRIDNSKKEYVRDNVANTLSASKRQITAFKVLQQQATVAKTSAQKSKIVPLATKKNADCDWHSVTGAQETSKACIKKFPDATVHAVLDLVDQVRSYELKFFPIRLLGLPLLNVDLPIYNPNGVIKPGYLPVQAETGSFVLSLTYFSEPLPTGFFDPPTGFKSVHPQF